MTSPQSTGTEFSASIWDDISDSIRKLDPQNVDVFEEQLLQVKILYRVAFFLGVHLIRGFLTFEFSTFFIGQIFENHKTSN